MLPSTLYIMWPCTYKVWICYVKRLRRRCIYKKYITWPLTLTLGSRSQWNVAQYPLHHLTYAPTKFEVATSKGLERNAFTRKYIIWLWVKVTRNVAQIPLTHVNYSATKFECATSNGLGGDIHLQETGRMTDRLRYKINIPLPFFLKKKVGKIIALNSEIMQMCRLICTFSIRIEWIQYIVKQFFSRPGTFGSLARRQILISDVANWYILRLGLLWTKQSIANHCAIYHFWN